MPFDAEPAERLVAPKWLTATERKLFRQLQDELTASGVPLKAIDAHSVGMAARTLRLASECPDDPRQFGRLGRDAMGWLEKCGATVLSRARLGIRPKPKAVKDRTAAVKEAIFG